MHFIKDYVNQHMKTDGLSDCKDHRIGFFQNYSQITDAIRDQNCRLSP